MEPLTGILTAAILSVIIVGLLHVIIIITDVQDPAERQTYVQKSKLRQ